MDVSDFVLVKKGDSFSDSKDVKTAIQQAFLRGGRGCFYAEGGGYSKLVRCRGERICRSLPYICCKIAHPSDVAVGRYWRFFGR